MTDNISMRNLTFVILISSFVFSCTRSNDSATTNVQITLPVASSSASSTNSLQVKKSNSIFAEIITPTPVETELDGESYLDIEPSGVTTGTFPINCYLAAVEGPEATMSHNYCGSKDASLVIQPTYKFGTYVGLRQSGQTLTLEVPTGKDRIVHLFGFHAVSLEECKLLAEDPSKQMLSHPYHLGKSEPVNLEGRDIEVVVNLVNPAATNKVDDCVFTELPAVRDLATHVALNTQVFPFNITTKPSASGVTCEPLNFSLISNTSTYKAGVLTSDSSYELVMMNLANSARASRVVYETYVECAADLNSKSSFQIKKERTNATVWVRLVAGDNVNTKFEARSLSSVGVEALPVELYITNQPTTQFVLDTNLPRRIVPGVCYPFIVYTKLIFGSAASVITTREIAVSVRTSDGASQNNIIYPNSSCGGPGETNVEIPGTNSESSLRYIKFENPADINELSKIELRPNVGTNPIVDTDIPIKYKDQAAASPTVSRVQIRGPSVVGQNGTACVPIQFSLLDQVDAPIVPTTNGNYIIESSRTSTDLLFYSNADCATGQILFDDNAVYLANRLSTVIYVKVTASSGLRVISIKANGVVSGAMSFRIKSL